MTFDSIMTTEEKKEQENEMEKDIEINDNNDGEVNLIERALNQQCVKTALVLIEKNYPLPDNLPSIMLELEARNKSCKEVDTIFKRLDEKRGHEWNSIVKQSRPCVGKYIDLILKDQDQSECWACRLSAIYKAKYRWPPFYKLKRLYKEKQGKTPIELANILYDHYEKDYRGPDNLRGDDHTLMLEWQKKDIFEHFSNHPHYSLDQYIKRGT